ncbi:Asp-tRNA(Asn)/Glu-tRNA(Gln) amidotransferase subunit GatC [Clostridiisalibacter paucivorans]|uniref:Asp-tRNA(Asn)/Glu-tRNA(Gln) amidotransferase subunit GatC n=1 Tax=Clostridiisalibacter paucivorans TaxID=408753 RepID=UPI00047B378F|nr:Asp-tRNA(Asn)/Glu-tRNA(Gln) amidotransferase subunit GatC [Clostridiisalibacter paucivorans]
MSISSDDVRHVAKLARLEFHDNEIEDFTEKFDAILKYVEKLEEVNTDEVEPTYHVHPIKNVMREDVAGESLDRKDALKNAPEDENGYFKLPNILE